MAGKKCKSWTNESGLRVRLGRICKRGHDFLDSGLSIKRDDNGDCLECSRLRSLNRVLTPEQRKQYNAKSREYHHTNRNEINAKRSADYHASPEVRASQKMRGRKHYLRNKDLIASRALVADRANPGAHNFRGFRALSREKSTISVHYTYKDVLQRFDLFNGACAYCKTGLDLNASARESNGVTWDHVIALSQGGPDLLSHIVPCCWTCNASKWANDVTTWYKSKEFYDAERLQFILNLLEA